MAVQAAPAQRATTPTNGTSPSSRAVAPARIAQARAAALTQIDEARRALWQRTREALRTGFDLVGGLWDVARREGIPRLMLLMLLLHLTISATVYVVERATFVPNDTDKAPQIGSLGDAFWWTIVTMTTTGYGDIVPKTTGGRLVASVLMVSGALLISIFTASFASMLVAQRLRESQGLSVLKVKNHIIIIGWDNRGEQVIAGLVAASGRRPQVVLVNQLPDDQLGELTFRYRHLNLRTVRGDATHEAVLARANLAEAAAVIVLTDSSGAEGARTDDRTLFVSLAVRDANPTVKIAALLRDTEKEVALRNAGVDEVVVAGADSSFFLASGALAPGLARAARQLLTYGSGRDLRRLEFARELKGLTFREARAYYRASGLLLIGIISEGAVVTIGDVLGSSTDWVDEFIRSAFNASGQDVVDEDQDRTQAIIAPPDDYVIGNKDSAVVIGGG